MKLFTTKSRMSRILTILAQLKRYKNQFQVKSVEIYQSDKSKSYDFIKQATLATLNHKKGAANG